MKFMNKNIFVTLTALFTLVIFAAESKGQQDRITGMYEDHPFKKYNNKYPYGKLEILKVSKDKIKF